MKDLYAADLINKYSGHTFTETTIGGMFQVEFKNGSSVVVAKSKKNNLDDAYKSIRNSMLDGNGVASESTAAQRSAMSNIMDGARTWDLDTSALLVFKSGSWA